MAEIPATDPNDPLFKQMSRLVTVAKQDRAKHEARISDCYKYALPWRHKLNQHNPSDQLDEVFDPTAMTVLEDFAADMLNTFTPQKNNWLEEVASGPLDAGERRLANDQIKRRQGFIFSEMSRSNLYQALQEAYLDLGPGTMMLLVKDFNTAEPIHCEAIPQTEALLHRGPFGFVDGVFREKTYRRADVKVLWPDAKPYDAAGYGDQEKQEDTVEITDGCWRDWSVGGTETYWYAVMANGVIIYRKDYTGPGSCPFIVARWSRDPTTAWGVGPTYRSMPDIKTLNHVRYLDLKNYDKHVDPVTSYEDDGIMNVDQGVEPGDWIPRAVGSKPPEALESAAKFDVAVFERNELRSQIKAAHYQDKPEQRGKTPPSATQWADEAAERARRMGSPATNLVQELQIPLYKRFAFLLDQRGVLPRVELNGRTLSLQPVSPLLRAQEQEEVVRNDRFAELITARFGPQVAMIVIDIVKYAGKQAEKLGVDPDLVRDENKIASAIEQLLPVLKAASGGGGGPVDVPPALVQGGAA